jgi:hypothetical protein
MTRLRPSLRPAWLLAVLVLTGSALASAPASAGPITFGQWLEFGFIDVGTPATGCDPADPAGPFCIASSGTPTSFLDAPPWTITAPSSGFILTVTDAFTSGDQFQLFDFGVPIGLTSFVAPGVVDCGDDPAICLANAGISHAQFALGAGAHSLTLRPTISEGGGGAGYLRADVPEPTTMMLVATGFGLTVLRRRRARG